MAAILIRKGSELLVIKIYFCLPIKTIKYLVEINTLIFEFYMHIKTHMLDTASIPANMFNHNHTE